MKKSSIKYFGVTAAALLAVAPMAAQTVSSSQGNTVAAADSNGTNQITNAINNLPSSATATGDVSSAMANALNHTEGYNASDFNSTFSGTSDAFLSLLSNPNWRISDSQGYDYSNTKIYVSQANGWSANDTQNTIDANTANGATYPVNFTVKAVNTDNGGNNVVASKNITVNFGGKVADKNLKATFNSASAKVGDSVSSLKLGYQAINALTISDANGNTQKATAVSADVTTTDKDSNNIVDSTTNKFNKYGTATQTLTFTLPAVKSTAGSTTTYVAPSFAEGSNVTPVNGDNGSNVDQNKKTATFSITRDVVVYDGNQNYQPYFSVKQSATDDSGVAVSSNSNIAVPSFINNNQGTVDGYNKKLADITESLNKFIVFNVNDANKQKFGFQDQDVKNALVAAGAKVENDGTVKNLSNVYYLTLTGYSPVNNKSATVKVPVNFSATETSTDKSAPVFQGTEAKTIIQGQNFNAYDNVKAFDNGYKASDDASAAYTAPQIMSGYWTVQNSVNTNIPGDYNVVYSVVNSQGLTTSVTRKVTVLPVNGLGKDQVVNFVPGYGVMVWSATDNAVNATSDFVQHGTTVKTFDTKTVDGVSYTRINSANSNQWVQSKYFDANANNAPQTNNNTNTDSNQETPFEGVLTINYVPGYRVFLRDGQANMQQQSVAHGESFKVWAKKTVGNHTYYRIGTDAQWIEDTYAQF